MSDCPSKADFEEYLAGHLAEEEVARLESHVADCSACRTELDGIRSDNRVFDQLQRAHAAETVSEPDHADSTKSLPPRRAQKPRV